MDELLDFLSANRLINSLFCDSIEAVFSVLSMLHMGERQRWVNPPMVKHFDKNIKAEKARKYRRF